MKLKSLILIFTALTYTISLLMCIIYFELNFKVLLNMLLSILSIVFVFYYYKNIKKELCLIYLTFLYLSQSFNILIGIFIYKFCIGPNIFLNLYYEESTFSSFFSMQPFQINLILNSVHNTNDFLIGINFIHFALFIFYNNLWYNLKKK
jgi:hypothetical protein